MPDLGSAPHCERDDRPENCGIEITLEMIKAGAETVMREVGGAEGLGGYFSAPDLAVAVFRSMSRAKNEARAQP